MKAGSIEACNICIWLQPLTNSVAASTQIGLAHYVELAHRGLRWDSPCSCYCQPPSPSCKGAHSSYCEPHSPWLLPRLATRLLRLHTYALTASQHTPLLYLHGDERDPVARDIGEHVRRVAHESEAVRHHAACRLKQQHDSARTDRLQ